ncbi:DNA-binding Lrp family transcriptional regulator [Mycolicibacterium sp. BK556]|uniref:Lrp/AsnC family transcriptional regulator n=1 Tax=unclassified Mycolicibacterium TaxID=2636767 RepID=UPI0010433C79|nr:DNA-binding Lrp family transcriptional regulator [Mycolicibacterium sp. BK556]MBB3636805.1 DNA-binding Lrp family transcriptional regulator [Mycolicibacterium sp. BK607]
MDDLDRAIIMLLQKNGRWTNQELAAEVGLTAAPCLRRVRRLEADGVITGYSANVDAAAMGRGFEVIIHADLVAKDLTTVETFEQRVASMIEVVELRRMFGLPDYFLRVQVADLAAYERWLTTQLMGDPAIARVDSRITMKVVKAAAL